MSTGSITRRITGKISIGVVEMFISDCAECGSLFGITTELEARLRYSGRSFWCPNGHRMSFTGEEAELRKRVQDAEREANRQGSRAKWATERAETAERSRDAYKGHLTRAKKRIGNGVCPCCNRHFANVERHMKGQHPDYVSTEEPS